jgi:hypothetical protein
MDTVFFLIKLKGALFNYFKISSVKTLRFNEKCMKQQY